MISQRFWQRGSLGSQQKLPTIIFGQVREDARTELTALQQANPTPRVFCIASGGCTAFALLAAQPAHVLACDINPAQIALVALKKSALSLDDPIVIQQTFLASVAVYPRLAPLLSHQVRQFWGCNGALLKHGLNNSGLIDRRLQWVMKGFYALVHSRRTTERMLRFDELAPQQTYFARMWQSTRWRACFRLLNPWVLSLVYGNTAAQALPLNFHRQMRHQVEDVFQRFVTARNPYLWQTFMPGIPPPSAALLPDYLQAETLSRLRNSLSQLTLQTGEAAATIRESERPFDFFALSNILEGTEPAYAQMLAQTIGQQANPGALVVLRFIFPPAAEVLKPFFDAFQWQEELSQYCATHDRSLFCRKVLVFRKV